MSDGAATTLFFGGLIALVVGIFTAVATISVHSEHVACLRLHENTQLETKVARSGMVADCYIQLRTGEWIPADRYRGIDGDL